MNCFIDSMVHMDQSSIALRDTFHLSRLTRNDRRMLEGFFSILQSRVAQAAPAIRKAQHQALSVSRHRQQARRH